MQTAFGLIAAVVILLPIVARLIGGSGGSGAASPRRGCEGKRRREADGQPAGGGQQEDLAVVLGQVGGHGRDLRASGRSRAARRTRTARLQMKLAAEICIYTNDRITIEELGGRDIAQYYWFMHVPGLMRFGSELTLSDRKSVV